MISEHSSTQEQAPVRTSNGAGAESGNDAVGIAVAGDPIAPIESQHTDEMQKLRAQNEELWAQATNLGRELLDTRARLLAEADQPELQRLRSENESLWAQATSLGQQLLETRSRIEFDRAAQAEEVERLRREHATSDAQLHELGRELLDARQRLEIAETNRTFASAFCRQRP